MQAQTTTLPATGEYYLLGVMETASGFKLNADSTFEFFFSYGAMDRPGEGHWKQDGHDILFNSTKKTQQDYTLLQSKTQAAKGITLQISGSNAMVNKLVHAIVRYGTKEEQAAAGSDGRIHFTMEAADSIIVLFEWCPDKRSVFTVQNPAHNFFEFKIEPSIMEVLFTDFRLQLNEEGLSGPHPLMATKTFRFKKAGH